MLYSQIFELQESGDGHKIGQIELQGIPSDQLVLVYSLELNAFNKNKLFRCEKYNRIRFVVSPSLFGRKISLFTNYNKDYTLFNRKVYSEFNQNEFEKGLQFQTSGSFHFYYTEVHKSQNVLGSFYIVVSPELSVRQPNCRKPKAVPINSIQCQTVLSKCMGQIDTMKDKLKVSIKSGYNMIHWTPIQELGGSKSAYSLANQHRINPNFCSQSMIKVKRDCQLRDIADIVNWLRDEHGVFSITDIVLNHTANESPWLKEHPEVAYNCANSPWLRPAFLLDRLFWHLTLDIEDGRWADRDVTKEITSEKQLSTIRDIFIEEYLPLLNLEEFYICNPEQVLKEFEDCLRNYLHNEVLSDGIILNEKKLPKPCKSGNGYKSIEMVQDIEYRRFGVKIDYNNAILWALNEIDFKGSMEDEESIKNWIDFTLLRIKDELSKLNDKKRNEIKNRLYNAVDNVIKGARYERLDPAGPKKRFVSKANPLATQYFTDEINGYENKDLIQIEKSLFDVKASCFYMAHNGWVMGDDPLRNFAEADSWVYFNRELVCWGDSVKLRYGLKIEDSPYLWSFMEEYVKQMASTFQGLRLDNCHSTPIHVAQHMIDAARRVNPDLYLVAELFTSSEDLDNIFVNKLGINSLIREAMSAGIPFELGRQVYRFSGEPVGSFQPDTLDAHSTKKEKFYMRPFVQTVAHAILFDQTHDNESPIIRRTPYDPLPSAALVSMTYAATGSNRGLDELVPHHIHVVNEERPYSVWDDSTIDGVNDSLGIISAKKALNQLHNFLGSHGFSQVFVDQRDRDTIAVTRHNPFSHKSVILVARTAFYPLDQGYSYNLAPLKIEGKFEKILYEMKMSGEPENDRFIKAANRINGYINFRAEVKSMIDSKDSEMIDLEIIENATNLIKFKNFSPSSVIVFSVSLLDSQQEAVSRINGFIREYNSSESDIVNIVNQLDLIDINYILFRCNQEESDESAGHGVYCLSNGPFIFCGLAGIMYHLQKIRTHNDLGHPLCANLRDGDWLPQYIVSRLKRRKSTLKLANWVQNVFEPLSKLPRYLIPRYFDTIMLPLYTLILDRIWDLSSDFVRHGDDFIKRLALGGVALIGSLKSSPLPPISLKSIPLSLSHLESSELPTIAAGLPHFASGYMRNWGRDTFISIKGLTLLTGRFDIAKVIILGFAGTLRHGLIPNLLDGGFNSRYNCRDAVWWWLQAIKDYIQIVPDGYSILNDEVQRIFPIDSSLPSMKDCVSEPLHKTIQEALDRHFQGIEFVERNAGTKIDAHMKDDGFHVKAGVCRETGFVYGGNQWNCGTWMDKMGSSDKAGNRGHPATPRDGSAVEIIGLCKSIISFLSDLHRKNIYPYEGVKIYDSKSEVQEFWSFDKWSQKIQDNFDKYFYIDENCTDTHVNRKKIYKDTVGASKPWMDYQFRPNFFIPMCVAPELFNREHAIEALAMAQDVLLGPLGMKTLDPSDWSYRADYDNSNDSEDGSVANGFNYHNGPEWLWPTGYYLMARLKFNVNHSHEVAVINQLVSKHYQHLSQSDWFGLPELTNSNGSPCLHSCPIQAWSHATMLELLHLKNFIEKNMIFD